MPNKKSSNKSGSNNGRSVLSNPSRGVKTTFSRRPPHKPPKKGNSESGS